MLDDAVRAIFGGNLERRSGFPSSARARSAATSAAPQRKSPSKNGARGSSLRSLCTSGGFDCPALNALVARCSSRAREPFFPWLSVDSEYLRAEKTRVCRCARSAPSRCYEYPLRASLSATSPRYVDFLDPHGISAACARSRMQLRSLCAQLRTHFSGLPFPLFPVLNGFLAHAEV